jgi:LPXTG-motif cell wall-anchored protein
MTKLFLVEDDGGEDGSSKKQANERSVNGNSDYGKKEAKDTENSPNTNSRWYLLLGFGIILLLSLIIFFVKKNQR